MSRTLTGGLFDSGEVQPGETYEYTFDEAGTFDYHCTPHPWMQGRSDGLTERRRRLSVGGRRRCFPVNFVVDRGTVLFCTAAGKKLSSIEDEPVVAFEADRFDWHGRTAWSVVIKGAASQVTDPDELSALRDGELDSWQHDRKPFFIRIAPSMTTGRRFTVHHRVEP